MCPEHARALHHAHASGITLIDTSANYADGGSEELIGQVLGHLVEAGELRREAVTVVSKAGYLQGQNHALSLARRRAGRPFPVIVPYAGSAVKQVAAIRSALASADTEWSGDGPLSRLSLRALRSTEGVSCVLIGMRRPAYVEDVLAELDCPIKQRERRESWQNLSRLLRPE
ncbi:MAG: aldo/keto reductase [Desulfobacterales bacterium]